ncbi:hypothetical protein [Haloferax sp. Atlit-48N]|uniref:Uncharacterized protein n=1 Tax=Haloferax sp. Atlit-48N TaxID=2077198 RepID=A0ACD5I1A3_9EURY|nr:hypothetical protein [Haloferax sp. Atlit-48N]
MRNTITTDALLLIIIISLYVIGIEVATVDHTALFLCVAGGVIVTIFSILTGVRGEYLKELLK